MLTGMMYPSVSRQSWFDPLDRVDSNEAGIIAERDGRSLIWMQQPRRAIYSLLRSNSIAPTK